MAAHFSWAPSQQTSAADEYSVLKAKYGGLYEQRVQPYGQTIQRVYNIRFTNIPLAETQAIMAYLRAQAGMPFPWVDPFDSADLFWTCENPEFSYNENTIMGLSAVFRQYFLP